MATFREAVDARDLDAVEAMLADDVVFHSPVAFKPYVGKPVVSEILRAVIEVFEGFHYVRELHDGPHHALVFEAQVDGLTVTGCDFLVLDGEGKVAELMVMVRPLKAAQALAARMGDRFPAIQAAVVAKLQGAQR
ncbi:nuclear transport factor 2 family protein [Sandaracinus amylolyticus]|uniref:SnoaL-like domain-containing protein n=1 Tax=Sandaracinus amylolyticus TaxID=927083 RepID=A0A0F6YFF6_9BACT|nr:nuclear transport factor 2 family protein [Sandaracinus amylolyticus]AKF03563.1 hypothetical protein DB32_000712 [Sandaracinus amylolyticus]